MAPGSPFCPPGTGPNFCPVAGKPGVRLSSLGPVHPRQQALKNLDRAIREALDRKNPKRFPRFKRKGEGDSLRDPDPLPVKLDLSVRDKDGRNVFPRIFLPKVGWGRVRLSRQIAGEIKNATVTRKARRWAVSIQTERDVPEPLPRTSPEVGLDLGVAPFASRIDPASLTFLSGETIGEGLATSFRSDLVGSFFVADARWTVNRWNSSSSSSTSPPPPGSSPSSSPVSSPPSGRVFSGRGSAPPGRSRPDPPRGEALEPPLASLRDPGPPACPTTPSTSST
ncbi:MAG: hypothetical protein ACP5OP_05965 [Leptospirillia bacterium]